MALQTKNRNYVNFNNQDYDFIVEFDNGERVVSLNGPIIEELQIVENFINWYAEGYIIIDNQYDHFERFGKVEENERLNPDELDYKYRGDGRDIIRISILPRIESTAENIADLPTPVLKNEIWEIFLEGVIYDVEELPGESIQNKKKKFYFWEKEYHMMLEKNIEFTTAKVGENLNLTDIHKLSDYERSLKTGEAILELLKSVEEFQGKLPDSPDDESWVLGDNKNKVFYTSPSNYKIIDDLNYLLSYHTDSEKNNYDVCFLQFNRRKQGENKKFSLLPLSKYFEKAGTNIPGDYQLEKFYLNDLNETRGTIPLIKTPDSVPNFEKNIMILNRNEIDDYQFVEMSGMDSSELVSIFPVHSYHRQKGQFNIHISDNTPEAAKTFQETQYLNKIGKLSSPRLQLNTWKKNGYNLKNVWKQSSREGRYAEGRNRIIMSSLLNGSAIAFSAIGQTSRQAGRFISIVKPKYNDTDFDDRLEGQYLTMSVTHNFNFPSKKYTNDIIATKLHRYRDNKDATPEDDSELLS